ncbi:unnamed protein product [Clonostachys rosea]|uniref:Uncharacterized protein n=1 Tax=Bionectria ochroleuca TaxID=29856 RepID=A0ABY6TUX8_BIOOC|nr:unnamed protein product [Clonostachys rosea]
MDSFIKIAGVAVAATVLLIIGNVIRQLLPKSKTEPPAVFHWIPIVGNAITYGMDPPKFFAQNREKYGDIFSFTLFNMKVMCYFGVDGNEFILNGKVADLNAEEVYGPLTVPVFGADVVYGCPNAKFMQQKKFVKFALTQKALEDAVPIIEKEVADYIKTTPGLKGQSGTLDMTKTMNEVNIFTASRAIQGEEIRSKLSREYARVYNDLDNGLQPVNFLLPWFPFPHNRKRDLAHIRMRNLYLETIQKRRKQGPEAEHDMIWNLLNCKYKDGTPIPDKEIAHMMITMLLGGQHSSASSSSWMLLHIASRPEIGKALYQEQLDNLSKDKDGKLLPLTYADLDRLPLLKNVVKETLRTHSSIHSVMRKVTRPLEIPGTPYILQPNTVMLSSPLVTQLSEEHFPNASEWNPSRWESKEEKKEEEEKETKEEEEDGDLTFSKGARSPYLPFGAGRHRCIGEKFAYLNLEVIVSTFVRHFHLSNVDGSREVPPTDYSSLFSRPTMPAIIRWERRVPEEKA